LLRQPVEVFLRQRLQVRFDKVEEAQQELEPFTLNGLENYHAGQSLLQATDPGRTLAELRLSGVLPMAAFGERETARLADDLDVVLQRRARWREEFPTDRTAFPVDLQISGVPLTGTLNGLWRAGADGALLQISERLGAVLEGSAGARAARGHIITGLWVNHLAACASGLGLTSVQLGLDGEVVFAPLPVERASAILHDLVDDYRQAWMRPLPVACKTAWAYLQVQARAERAAQEQPDKPDKAKDPHEVAQSIFEGDFKRESELTSSPYLARVFEAYADIEDALPQWAQRLYGAMAQHAEVRSE